MTSSSDTRFLGVPLVLVRKIGSAASARGRPLTVRHTTQPDGVHQLLGPFFEAQEDAIREIVCELHLLPGAVHVKNCLVPCCKNGSRMGLALIRTLECGESIPAFSRNDLSSKLHTLRQSDVLWTHDNSVQLTRCNHQSSHIEWYVGGSCAIALTPKRSLKSLALASRHARTALSLSERTLNSGYPTLCRDSTVSMINFSSSTPLHCTSMLQIIFLGFTFTTGIGAAPFVVGPSLLKACSCPSVKNL